MNVVRAISVAIVLASSLRAVGPVFAVDITQCGQVVPPGEIGILRNDLACAGSGGFCFQCLQRSGCCSGVCFNEPCATASDCMYPEISECASVAVGLGNRATLLLNGFSISGVIGNEPEYGVVCERRCTVRGPGELARFGEDGIKTYYAADVAGVAVRDCGRFGVYAGHLRARNVTATGNLTGMEAGYATIEGITVNANRSLGLAVAYNLRASDLTANGNGLAGMLLGGLGGHRSGFRIRTLTATGNGGAGLVGNDSGGAIVGGVITGNNGGGVGVDIATSRRPRLRDAACTRSAQLGTAGAPDYPYLRLQFGDPWGVCADD